MALRVKMMKKMSLSLGNLSILLTSLSLTSVFLIGCATTKTSTPIPTPITTPASPATVNKTDSTQTTKQTNTAQTGNNTAQNPKPGGYYLDDGPSENPPFDIDKIPNATPKKESLITRSNKPYRALGATYTPMTYYQPYNATGVASWYGKRYHGRKTSSGEVYDMYAMTAAHPTLPLPSYVKVSNPANGRSVIVRVNDRGPFKKDRLIDLSYAAAYKLRFTNSGSTLVDVQALDASSFVKNSQAGTQLISQQNSQQNSKINVTTIPSTSSATTPTNQINSTTELSKQINSSAGYFVQAGAFKNAINADALIKKIQDLDITQNAVINSVYNKGIHRLKLGPFESKQQAEQIASQIRNQLSTAAVTIFQ